MLSPRQQQILKFIQKHTMEYDYAPTIQEIINELGIASRSMVQRALERLEIAECIRRIPGRKRNIELLVGQQGSLPLVGKIAAGQPIEAISDPQSIDINDLLLGDNRFVLQVRGDSMLGDNICDGDFVICETCQSPGPRDIAVVLVDQEHATLKRLQWEKDKQEIQLIASNPAVRNQRYAADRVQVQGRFVGLLRLPEMQRAFA